MRYEDKCHFQFKTPFTCMVVGPQKSGKTYRTREVLKHFKTLFTDPPKKLKVLWCYGVKEAIDMKKLSKDVNIFYAEGLPPIKFILKIKPDVIVLDDLMIELGNDKELSNLFTRGSHHHKINIIFLSQNLFYQGSQMVNVGVNSDYYILLKNPSSKRQIKRFAIDRFPDHYKDFMKAYHEATAKPYGYIRIDFTQTTPEDYRVSTRLTPQESNGLFTPICYILDVN